MDGFFSRQPKNNSVSEICLIGFMVKNIVFKNLFRVLSIITGQISRQISESEIT